MTGRHAVGVALKTFDGQSGLLFDVRWPVTSRLFSATTELVTCKAHPLKGVFRSATIVSRSRTARRRPFFQPLPPGDYKLDLASQGRRHRHDVFEVNVTVHREAPLLVTCFPAKKRLVTDERPETQWLVGPR